MASRVLVWFSFVVLFYFSQNWAWVDHLTGGGGSHYSIDCAVGKDSNSYYFCGRYRATATFYSQDGIDVVNPPHGGSRDIFLAKTDSAGHFLWVKTIGGSDTEYGFSVTVDENDNVYLTGQFYTSCNFQGTTITSAGREMFM
ncbi:MAG: SBBP repeat-containing protein [Crocinitomicaceae bacterium]|nr:SBBP repeat-containing protein [Crocinitomicaceae bacterium]